MSEVTRWKPTTGDINKIKMEVSDSGKYVKHSDYLALRQQLAEETAKVIFCEGRVIFCEGRMIRLEAKIADLTAKVAQSVRRSKIYKELFIETRQLLTKEKADHADKMIKLNNLIARFEAQEASEPVNASVAAGVVGYLKRVPFGVDVTPQMELDIERALAGIKPLYTTPQQTPNVKAAVAAAYRKAAEVCVDYETNFFETRLRNKILALPHDDSALREFGLAVINAWIDRDLSEQETVDFVLGEKK